MDSNSSLLPLLIVVYGAMLGGTYDYGTKHACVILTKARRIEGQFTIGRTLEGLPWLHGRFPTH